MAPSETSQSRTWRKSPDLLGVANQAGIFIETNPAWQKVLGWTEAEIGATVFTHFLHPDDLESTLAVFEALKAGKPALYFKNRYRCKDGSYKWLSWVAVPEDDVFICSARDVTADMEREGALKTKTDEAELREQFVAILGHDLRNPLASILSAVRIARREAPEEPVEGMLTAIQGSAMRMSRLIDETMDFARARLGGGIPVDMEQTGNLQAGFQRVIDEILLAHPVSRITFTFDFDGMLHCDAPRLDQLLSNLVANAVTHGDIGQPIAVRASGSDGHLVLTVANAGEPIPQEVIPHLFKPFERLNERQSLQGLGLGLYIANEIARAHGGSLSVTSDEEATVFRLEIPATAAP